MTVRLPALTTILLVALLQAVALAPAAAGRVIDGGGVATTVATPGLGASPVPPLRWPVLGPIAATFDPPESPWSSGHRGVDLVAPSGTPLAAMADGTVGFVGPVAGAWWVSLDHGSRVRTTIGPIAVTLVALGDDVTEGQVVATAAGTAHGGSTDLVHLSVRVDGVYVDPLDHLGRLVATLRVPPG